MSHLFSLTPKVNIQRSAFDRSHNYKATLSKAGRLYPIFVDEVLPGDTFNLKATIFARMSTPIVPIMDNLYFETFWFFVPDRLVWSNFQKFMGEQEDPDDSIDYLVPQFLPSSLGASYTVAVDSVMDYMGIPTGAYYGKDKQGVNALPLRAYYLIWNEWFRSETLQDSVKFSKGDSGVHVGSGNLDNGFKRAYEADSCLPRGKRFDYFTGCAPSPQKFQAMTLPLIGNAPVFGNGKALGLSGASTTVGLYQAASDNALKAGTAAYGEDVGADKQGSTDTLDDAVLGVVTKTLAGEHPENSGLYADLTNVSSATVNDLRTAFQIQRLLESQNRSGTRYTEILRGQFSVVSPDARLQRPEYLGGSSCRININPVQQTSGTVDGGLTPQGNLAAYGVVSDRVPGFVKSFVEHGYIIGLANIRADLNYQQGLNRMWSRRTRYDFYWPTLAHLGEQAVLNKEIYLQGSSDDEGVFGYQERWSEYRYKPNQICGKFRSTDSTPLDIWHLAQKFDSLPQLSNEFIQDNPPVDRVVAVPSEPEFLLDIYYKLKCVRPMPVYSIPGLIDHF